MTTTSMTTMEVKKINKHNIYTFIYQQKNTSKQQIVESLHISLSTVTQNLKLLENEGLIHRAGYYESTGGRKAYNFNIVKDARIALGIGILKDHIHIVVIDLYGTVIKKETHKLIFSACEEYYLKLGKLVSTFLQSGNWNLNYLLGAGIAIQGIADKDGTTITYGPILNNSGLQIQDIAKYIPCQCFLIHDSKAAALAEIWYHKDITDAIVLLLNENLGSTLISNQQIHYGENLHGGLLEHMSIDPNGPLCYCGSHGCLETFCSANSLKNASALELDLFYSKLRNNDNTVKKIWTEYLNHLAFAIRNLQVILDVPVIVSGLISNYMIPEDFHNLRELIKTHSPFPFSPNSLLSGHHGSLAPAIGGALYFIDKWLQNV